MAIGAGRRARAKSNEQRYHEIVVIAGELFADKGFAGTSLQDIADAVGMLKGSLYHYIDSKEDLLFDVIKVAHQGLFENIRVIERFSSDPVSQLAAFVYGHIALNAVSERIHRGIVFLRDVKFLPADKQELIREDRVAYDSHLRAIITRGQAGGMFETQDARLCTFSIIGVITSYIRWFKPGGAITPHDLARHAANFVLKAVLSDAHRPACAAVVDRVAAEIRDKSGDVQTAELEADIA